MIPIIQTPEAIVSADRLRGVELTEPRSNGTSYINASNPYPSRQALYEELLMTLIDAVLEVDRSALDGIMQGAALSTLKRKDIVILWRLCCWSWQQTLSPEREMLNAFMAVLRSYAPWLTLPDWAQDIDPEGL